MYSNNLTLASINICALKETVAKIDWSFNAIGNLEKNSIVLSDLLEELI